CANVQQGFQTELFDRMRRAAQEEGMQPRHVRDGLTTIAKMVVHTGHDPGLLTAEDVFEYRAYGLDRLGKAPVGTYSAWDLLRGAGILRHDQSLSEALRLGQRPTAELVDRHQIQCRSIRDMLVRYLDERRPTLDYGSFNSLASRLAGTFWADIERHHPGIDTLDLPAEVAEG